MPKSHDIIAIVGQITPQIASQIKRQAGDIVLCQGIDSKALKFGKKHIEAKHKNYFKKMGITSEEYVALICGQFNEIRKGNKGALMLVKRNGALLISFVRLFRFGKDKNYRVETAYTLKLKQLEKYDLLWAKSEIQPVDGLSQTPINTKPKKNKRPSNGKSLGQSKTNTNLGRIGINAKEARQKGFFVENGHQYNRQEKIKNIIKGKDTTVYFSLKEEVKGYYALIDASDLQPSHNGNIENPLHFLPDAQPRNRATSQSGADTPRLMAENLRPAEITEGATAYTGCPIINQRGEVIQGNGRAYALKYYWQKFEKDPKGYTKFIQKNKNCYGFKNIDAKIKEPVLVRMLNVDDDTAIRLGQFKQSDTEAVSTKTNEVKAKVSLITESQLESLLAELFNNVADDATLAEIIRGSKVLHKLIKLEIIRQDDLENYTKNNAINEEGVKFVSDFLVGLIFKGQDVNTPEVFKLLPFNIQNAIAKSSVYLLKAKPEGDLRQELSEAVFALRDYRNSGAKSINEFSKQYDIYGKTASDLYSPTALAIAKVLAESNSQKDVINHFSKFIDLVNGKPADAMGLYPATKAISKKMAIKEVFDLTITKEIAKPKPNTDYTYKLRLRLAEAEAKTLLLLN